MGNDSDLEAMVNNLEEEIVLWTIPPNTRLVEDQLMSRFSSKRHVVRAALDRLGSMGLVERIPNKGCLVRSYDLDDVEKLYAFRMIIEPAAAGLIQMPASATAVDDLREIQQRHDKSIEEDDKVGLFRSNHEFHRALFALCPNPFLTDSIEQAAMQAHAVRFSSLQKNAAQQAAQADHHAMIKALDEGDRETLVNLCRSHLQTSYNTHVKFIRSEAAKGG